MSLEKSTAVQSLSKGNILIVDDAPVDLRLLSEMLTEQGYEVQAASSGAQALATVHTTPPDLILLDILMPEMDGYEVCERLKADTRTAEIPVIFLSVLGQTEDKVKAFAMGGVDYITRPFKVGEVVARVGAHLGLRNLHKNLQEKNTQLEQEIAERARAEKALHKQTYALAQLYRLGQNLTATLDLQQISEHLSRVATDIVGVESVSVWLLDAEREGELVCWSSSDHFRRDPQRSPMDLRLHPGQGIAGWVVARGENVIVPNASSDPRFFPGIDQQIGFQTHALLAVPLRARDTIIGALEMLNKLSGEFTTDDVNLAETLAASAAIAIENARLVKELRQYAADLEAQNAELDAFAHTVAHDLKGSLGSIVGYAQVLEERYTTLPTQDVQGYLSIIAGGGLKMGSIIDELLLLASVRKMDEMTLEPLDMEAIVAGSQQRLAHLIKKHQPEITTPPAEVWPLAQGYGPWVEEVWTNYLSNAIKYGGHPPRIELGAMLQEDGFVRFWVRDNGPGLTLEEQARLFAPFERLHQARAKGHGLGLSIVQRIVEKLGGRVGVESAVGQGSVFYFTLPAMPIPPADAAATERSIPLTPPNRRA